MNYPQAVQFLYDLRRFGLKLGLDNILKLASRVGNPQEQLRFIHVAGTNGKGSTCAMLEAIYRASGRNVGLFTSPHLVSFRERIQINRRLISEEDVARLVEEFSGERWFTFFEAVTIMALRYFAEQHCDLVIWETGLGGRLDATNIVTPLASVITNVQLDHQEWLGSTLPEIAAEKAGIIKPGVPVITAAEEPALRVIAETAAHRGSPLTVVRDPLTPGALGLSGPHQRLNAAVAVATVRTLLQSLPVEESAVARGLGEAHWDGRLQIVQRSTGQTVLLDGAHNPAGAQALARALSTEFPERAPGFILGSLADKDCAGICGLLARLASRIWIAPVTSGRAAHPALLAHYCREANPAATVVSCEDLATALNLAAAEPFLVVTGSLHFIGEAIECLGLATTASERGLNEYIVPKVQIVAVTFDVGGTLIEPWPSVGDIYAEVAARHGLTVSPEALNRQFAAAWKRKRNFGHSMSDWSNLVDETFAGLAEHPPSATFFAELYSRFTAADAWRTFDDAIPTLQALRKRGLKLAAISNWDERLRPLLRALDLDRYFDTIVVSSEEGVPKPDAAIFRKAAHRLGVAPGQVLHAGDSQVEDFAGATAAGLQAVWVRREGGLRAPSEIARLSDVLEKI